MHTGKHFITTSQYNGANAFILVKFPHCVVEFLKQFLAERIELLRTVKRDDTNAALRFRQKSLVFCPSQSCQQRRVDWANTERMSQFRKWFATAMPRLLFGVADWPGPTQSLCLTYQEHEQRQQIRAWRLHALERHRLVLCGEGKRGESAFCWGLWVFHWMNVGDLTIRILHVSFFFQLCTSLSCAINPWEFVFPVPEGVQHFNTSSLQVGVYKFIVAGVRVYDENWKQRVVCAITEKVEQIRNT